MIFRPSRGLNGGTSQQPSIFVREHRAGRLSKEEALVGMVLSLSFANNNIKAAMGEMLAGRDPLNVF